MSAWWEGRLLGLDLETTSPDPEDARIVTAAIVAAGGGEELVTRSWLVDPGVEIPEEATAVHGVSTEIARAEGVPAAEAVPEIVAELERYAALGVPITAMNARFDLTTADREARRRGVIPLTDRMKILVLDPMVIDRWMDMYRAGPRKLEDLAYHYGAKLEAAHRAEDDALAAVRIAYWLGRKGRPVRRARNPREVAELAALEAEWAEANASLEALHAAQARWAYVRAVEFIGYLREKAKPPHPRDLARAVTSCAERFPQIALGQEGSWETIVSFVAAELVPDPSAVSKDWPVVPPGEWLAT